MRRRPLIFVAVVASLVVSVVLGFGLERETRDFVANVAAFLAMLSLAYPAIRINEQGRRIARIADLETSIRQREAALTNSHSDSAVIAEEVRTLQESREHLEAMKTDLSAQKGAWNLVVEICLVGGYLTLAGSMLMRIIPGG